MYLYIQKEQGAGFSNFLEKLNLICILCHDDHSSSRFWFTNYKEFVLR